MRETQLPVQHLLQLFDNVHEVAVFSVEAEDHVVAQDVHSLGVLEH